MKGNKDDFLEKLKVFLHDPIDKCFDIKGHEGRAKKYAEILGVNNIEEASGSDQIASCMERSLLPKEKVPQEFSEIKHPLSGRKINISNLKEEKEKLFNLIENVFEDIKKSFPNLDYKHKFFYLWRNLQEELFEKLKGNPLAKYLSILPADTRIPDHSIWEHLKITSAISAMWDMENKQLYQNNSLFLFTIGPGIFRFK